MQPPTASSISSSPSLKPPATQDVAERDDDMPLLFMDALPSDFQQNAQLAALATFMESDGDQDAQQDSDGAAVRGTSVAAADTMRKRHSQRAGRRAARKPYARPPPPSTKELSLFLSMFRVSKDDE
ncbi:hypothetical protein ATCC90586_008193 [Pythium insidiosum]|nr:hypothetical protein ATCC90586_008193 [Pythium insidiosum]